MYINGAVESVCEHLQKRRVGRCTAGCQNSGFGLALVVWRTNETQILRVSPQSNELSLNACSHFDLLAESSDFLVELIEPKITGNHLKRKRRISLVFGNITKKIVPGRFRLNRNRGRDFQNFLLELTRATR